MRAPHPLDEDERLSVLHRLELLDSEPEAVFDTLLSILGRTTRSDISLISLVDQDRQWFKSSIGVSEEEMPRSVAFCAYTILSDEVLSIPDATADTRVSDNPLVTGEMHVRAYIGAPIKVFSRRVGSVCAISKTPNAFGEADIGYITNIAAAVADQIRLRRNGLRKARLLEAMRVKETVGTSVGSAGPTFATRAACIKR